MAEGVRPHAWTNSFPLPAAPPVAQDAAGWRVALTNGLRLAFAAGPRAPALPRVEQAADRVAVTANGRRYRLA